MNGTAPSASMSEVVDWSRPYQLGVVVHDLTAACAHYESLGIGPFERTRSRQVVSREIFGAPVPAFEHETARAKLGPTMEIVLMQPAAADSPQRRALDERGEHVFHVCFTSSDLDRDERRLAERGVEAVSRGTFDNGGKYAVFDTTALGGVHLELFQPGRPVAGTA